MGERKVVNKYVPPDFDPSLVPRSRRPKDGLVSVRMMLPFSIQCSTCSTFMYRGRKFNSKKENVQGPNGKYLGIQRFRFYIKCTACSRPITFLTDPKNADYEMESGATRNYELTKDKQATEETAARELEEGEKDDPLKGLENRVLASQREMQDMDNLEEIKAMNMRHLQLLSKTGGGEGFDSEAKALLEARERKLNQYNDALVEEEEVNEDGLTKEDEALVKSIRFGTTGDEIRRLDEEDERQFEEQRRIQAMIFEKQQERAKSSFPKPRVPIVKVKRKRVVEPGRETDGKKHKQNEDKAPQQEGEGLSSLLGGYGSDSDSD